jgi:hypothetical protein
MVFNIKIAHPPPKTASKEWKEQTIEYMKANNINPIHGVSSKKDK